MRKARLVSPSIGRCFTWQGAMPAPTFRPMRPSKFLGYFQSTSFQIRHGSMAPWCQRESISRCRAMARLLVVGSLVFNSLIIALIILILAMHFLGAAEVIR